MDRGTEGRAGGGTRRWIIGAVVGGAVLAVGAGALLTNIMQRKSEAAHPFYRVVELSDTTTDPAIWGKNFPLQYDDYLKTVDMEHTKHGGSEAMPWTPTAEWDTRDVVSASKIEEDTRLKRMWAGYAFARDFREERGHAYMLDDQLNTLRTRDVKQPGTCMNCHASAYAMQKKLGDGDLVKGFEVFNQTPFDSLRGMAKHPVSCVDCHNPETMELRITRVAFMEGMKAYRTHQGQPDYDVNRDASRQEMRTYVCAQCHVEYYFKGDEKRLTFPWHKGLQADSILAYYDEVGFRDWQHKETGAPALKAQHPEFEMFSQGIHARSGVACADCHMPFKREGAMKISDHHVNSPLLKINQSCQACHKWSEQELKGRVEQIQDRHVAMRDLAFDALVALIDDIAAIQAVDSMDARLPKARDFQRKASFLVDFVEAENSVGFHAPQEAARVLTQALDYARQGQLALRAAPAPVRPGAVTATATRSAGAAPAKRLQ